MCECLKKLWDALFESEDDVINVQPGHTPVPSAPPVAEEPGERVPRKYALLVGINIYSPELDADLSGCVNDTEGMYDILVNRYDFDPEDIRVLTDERATKANIIDRLNWLIDIAYAGDELVFHYSGHGSQVRDRNGDELFDYLDEILCPHDLDWDDPLTDDIIASIFSKLPDDVSLTFVCDSCHSGTMSRELGPPSKNPGVLPKQRYLKPPFDIRARSMGRDITVNKIGEVANKSIIQNHVLMSGCRDDQTSADAYIDGQWQGAMTSSLLKAINKNPDGDWVSMHKDVLRILLTDEYEQTPQLTGDESLTSGRTIFGGKKK